MILNEISQAKHKNVIWLRIYLFSVYPLPMAQFNLSLSDIFQLFTTVTGNSNRTDVPMDRLHYGQNFEKSWSGKIYYHSIEEHPKISKIAKLGAKCCKMRKI